MKNVPPIGSMRHRMIVQYIKDEPQNSIGETEPTWSELARIKASLDPSGGRETFAAQQMNATVTHVIRCRYFSGLTPKMRILFGERVFNIEVVKNANERNRFYEILAWEEV